MDGAQTAKDLAKPAAGEAAAGELLPGAGLADLAPPVVLGVTATYIDHSAASAKIGDTGSANVFSWVGTKGLEVSDAFTGQHLSDRLKVHSIVSGASK